MVWFLKATCSCTFSSTDNFQSGRTISFNDLSTLLVSEVKYMHILQNKWRDQKGLREREKYSTRGATQNLIKKPDKESIIYYIITKSMRALWLVNQLWVIVPVNPWKNRASSELLYKSNRPQVSMGFRLINHLGCWKNTRRIRKPLACGSWFTNSSRVLPTSRLVYQPITHRNLWSIA